MTAPSRATPPGSSAPSAGHGDGVDHRVVMASAGTGKTHRLTNRLITLLTRGVRPSEVVATTFTRKAAGEILERVVDRLVRAASDERARLALADPGTEPPTRAQCLDAMRVLAGELDRVGILTIDSFFQRMAGALALEVGAAERRIADDAEDAALREEALATALEEAEPAEVAALVRVLFDGQPVAGVARRLQTTVMNGLLLLHETRRQPELWSARTRVARREGIEPFGEGVIRRLVESLRAAAPATKVNGEPLANWGKLIVAVTRALESQDLDGALSRLGNIERLGKYSGREVPAATLAIIEDVCGVCREALRARLHDRTVATRSLLERFERVYESLKADRGVWRFEDVPRVLLERIGSASLERLYYHLDGRVRHLLLDEFQDTSMTAFRLLEPLIDEIVSAEPPERSLFCVGDAKQSLYVWNGAEPELLGAVPERWPQVRAESMGVSRRSSGAIMHAVNQTLGTLTPARLAGREEVANRWAAQFPRHQAHDASSPGEVRLVVSTRDQPRRNDSTGDGPDIPASDIRATVERVRTLRAIAPECSIAVLARTNGRVARTIHALRSAGIDASEEGSGSLLDSAPVGVLRSLFHLADHPADSAAAYHVAASPLGASLGLTRGDRPVPPTGAVLRLASETRRAIETRGLSGAVLRIGALAWPMMDERDRSRFEAAADVARAVEAREGGSASDFVRAIDAARVRSVSDSVVRVMTIHASKGLEFDAVILAECSWLMRGRAREILAERSHPLGPIERVVCAPPKALGENDPELTSVVDHARDRLLSESLCLLYVAMTRARHVFEAIVSGPAIKPGKEDSTGIYPGRLLVESLRPDLMDSDEVGEFGVECVGVPANWSEAVRARVARAESVSREPERRSLAIAAEAPDHGGATGRLARVSPSSLEGGETRTLREILRPAGQVGRTRGTVLHALFETVEWLDAREPTSEDLERIAATHCAAGEEAGAMLDAFRRAIARPAIAAALSRASVALEGDESLDLWRERAFATRMVGPGGEPVLMSGRFDRVVVVRGPDGRARRAVLVDFKTDAVGPGAGLSARAEHYQPQVRAYRAALGAALGLDVSRVRAQLLFTEAGEVVEVDG